MTDLVRPAHRGITAKTAAEVLAGDGYSQDAVKRYLRTAQMTPTGMWPVGVADHITYRDGAYTITYKQRLH
jgi:hypothetical protein